MAFDFGWSWRGTTGYVTDPPYVSYAIDEAYPHTFTNANGESVNAGWTASSFAAAANRSTGVDVRLAGCIITNGNIPVVFSVDLTSGSAPGAGTYTADVAAGEQAAGRVYGTVQVLDDATSRLGPYSGTTSANTYLDASGTIESPGTASWDLVRVTQDVSITSGIARLKIDGATGNQTSLAHFRLTPQSSGISGSLSVTLAALTSNATGTVALAGSASPTLAALTSTATGVLPVAGVAAVTFEALSSTATGVLPVAGVAAILFEDIQHAMAGTVSISGALDQTLEALTLSATDHVPGSGAGQFNPILHHYQGL